MVLKLNDFLEEFNINEFLQLFIRISDILHYNIYLFILLLDILISILNQF